MSSDERSWVQGWSADSGYHRLWLCLREDGKIGELFISKHLKRTYLETIELSRDDLIKLARFIFDEWQPLGGTE